MKIMVTNEASTNSEVFYAFEAKSIQKYLFAGGRLRDVVGGSYLVDHLCQYDNDDLIGALIKNVLGEDIISDDLFSRRAGGACFFGPAEKSTIIKFRASLRLALSEYAPELNFVDAIIEKNNFGEALEVLADRLNESRNMFSVAATSLNPFTIKDPRTGGAGVEKQHGDIIDISIAAKRDVKQESRISVGAKYLVNMTDDKTYMWPVDTGDVAIAPDINLSDIDDGKNGMVGFIHADGNAVGQLIMKMATEAKKSGDNTGRENFRDFSEGMAMATLAAARHATETVLHPQAIEKQIKVKDENGATKNVIVHALPARPIVLGGDDLTIIVRADLAQEFTTVYLQAFEDKTREAFDKLRGKNNNFECLPTHLSAGAGIVYVSAKFPFDQCHELAEQIAGEAKTYAKQNLQKDGIAASTLLFHKMTFSLAGSKEQIKSDRTATIDEGEVHLTAGPYCVDGTLSPSIGAFNALYLAVTDKDEKVSGLTKLREIIGLLQTNPNEAQRLYDRWLENTRKRNEDYFASLINLTKACLGCEASDDNILLMAKVPNKEGLVCILADIIILNSMGYSPVKEQSNDGA